MTVGREADKVKPNGKKRMNLPPTRLPISLHRIAAARAVRPFQVTGRPLAQGFAGCGFARIAVAAREMPLDPDIM